MLRVDLHTHSSCSDGTLHPAELAILAKKKRVSVIALTDHDTVSGVSPFLSCCKKLGIKGVAGVEFSASYPSVLHIVGYRFDVKKIEESGVIKKIRDGRHERNLQICLKLQAMGMDVSFEDVKAESGGKIIARPHFARVLIKKGYAVSISEAFSKYLIRGAPAYVPRARVSAEECMSLIRDAGGLPVLAHPAQTAQGSAISELKPLIKELKDFGLWGIECYYSAHSTVQIYESLRLAEYFGLCVTAGSDFHGLNRPNCSIGMRVPHDMLPWARFCGGL